MTNSINNLIELVKPFDEPLTLYHGFEYYLQYNDDKWNIGDKITFPFHLSKTLLEQVAYEFATNNGGLYCAKVAIFHYSKKSSHLSSDIKTYVNPSDIKDLNSPYLKYEEYEFLGASNESFILKEIKYKLEYKIFQFILQFTIPMYIKYYIFKQ